MQKKNINRKSDSTNCAITKTTCFVKKIRIVPKYNQMYQYSQPFLAGAVLAGQSRNSSNPISHLKSVDVVHIHIFYIQLHCPIDKVNSS